MSVNAQMPVYLDYNATTPVAPEVLAAMLPWLTEHFGNPSSDHVFGQRAAGAVCAARREVADLIGATPAEIIFTGSATEANNLAILGVARALAGEKRHLVISAIEHPAVVAPALRLQDEGWALSVVAVDEFGRVDPLAVAAALRPDTALVSIMHANNEVGTVQPIAEIAALLKASGVLLHVDAAQSAGKLPVDVNALGADLLTLAGHKFYAPKGVGALYVRAATPIAAISAGAGQERGLRSGTESVPLIVALGAAARLAKARQTEAATRLRMLRDRLHERLLMETPGLQLNGHPEFRLPNTLHVSFPGVSGKALLAACADEVAASLGSACHAQGDALSGVLAAMGCDRARAVGAVRLSVGWNTSADEIDRAAAALIRARCRLVEGSPADR
jgi:cysteine desulfurase